MSRHEDAFDAASVLRELRVGAVELGYRAQALFAETLIRLGARIEDVARVGHPDVLARLGDRRFRVQVKSTAQHSFALDGADLEGIRPRANEEEGYLALLDLGPPVAWICVTHARICGLVGRTMPLAMLGSMAEIPFSNQCTDAFVEIVLEHRASIEAFTFSLISRRALAADR